MLEHFSTRLIAITKFADGLLDEIALEEANYHLKDEIPGSEMERLTIYIARVSNPKNQANPNIQKLLNSCIENGHVSVFEHGYMTVELKDLPIAITKQILRHRSFTFQELCVAGDTELYFDLPSAVKSGKRQLYKMRIDEFYRKWHEENSAGELHDFYIRVFDDATQQFTHAHVKDVMNTGIKPIFEVTLANGKTIRCSKEHKFYVQNKGWLPLEEAVGLLWNGETSPTTTQDAVIVCEDEWSKIESIAYLGEQQTYDLEIDHTSHNYVANGIVVHNSQRYADVSEVKNGNMFYIPYYRRQDKKNRQNSIDDLDEKTQLHLRVKTEHLLAQIKDFYESMIHMGVAKETARFILPQCTLSTLYMTGNIRSWIYYLKSRTDPSTQWEHRIVAEKCQHIFMRELPIISTALGWGSPTLPQIPTFEKEPNYLP